nr:uncharacterized protein LOC117273391 [Nicotiana tomentosiformis]
MRGHTKENYYKLIGYPDDYKNKRGGYQPRDGQARGTLTTANNVVGPTNMNTPGTSHTKSGDYFFTEAQYQQILNFLSKDESNETQTQAHMVKGIGRQHDGLYSLKGKGVKQLVTQAKAAGKTSA